MTISLSCCNFTSHGVITYSSQSTANFVKVKVMYYYKPKKYSYANQSLINALSLVDLCIMLFVLPLIRVYKSVLEPYMS